MSNIADRAELLRRLEKAETQVMPTTDVWNVSMEHCYQVALLASFSLSSPHACIIAWPLTGPHTQGSSGVHIGVDPGNERFCLHLSVFLHLSLQYKELECSLNQQAAEWVNQKKKEKKAEKTIRWAQVYRNGTTPTITYIP